MYVMLKKEYIEDLYKCIVTNRDAAYSIINSYVHDDKLVAAADAKKGELPLY